MIRPPIATPPPPPAEPQEETPPPALAVAPDAGACLARARAGLAALRARLRGKAPEKEQVLAWKLAWQAAEVGAAERLLEHAGSGARPLEAALASLFAAETAGEEPAPSRYDEAAALLLERAGPTGTGTGTATGVGTGDGGGDADEEHRLLRETFRRFAEERVRPLAERIHREYLLVPEEIVAGLRELGCFGLSLPARYGGFQEDDRPDNLGMVIATEELSRGSLGAAGSLVTRPEILAKALLKGGTEEQRRRFLPAIASGEKMVAIVVTEPDYGSDVASIRTAAVRTPEGGAYRLRGVKTWATFAGRAEWLAVLARTDPDPAKKHRGLSLFIAEKPPFDGHAFEHRQPGPAGGSIAGRAIPTIGYRGMHSFEVTFDDYLVPAENLVGGEPDGLGRGFYLQMEGFAGGRLQTAARACGPMQAALEAALRYAQERRVFGRPIAECQLARQKLVRMAARLVAARRLTYHAARLVDEGRGEVECSLVKLFAARTAEWVAREAQQLHGGMGYAEEFAVSRYFVDARVLSIFEGAEEVLALKVVARALLSEESSKEARR